MDALVNALIAAGLLLILLLIIYLIDRINTIERETRHMMNLVDSANRTPSHRSLDPFMGLSGKKLWDAMSGRPPEGMDAVTLVELRANYDIVLSKHIESLFQEGFKDGQRGMSGEPQNPRIVTTARAEIESWLPSAQVNTLYRCGLDAAQATAPLRGSIRAALDEVGQFLYGRTQISALTSLSDWLMPETPNAASPEVGKGL
jgi:hypothetical protein